jgi:hypothetical protein
VPFTSYGKFSKFHSFTTQTLHTQNLQMKSSTLASETFSSHHGSFQSSAANQNFQLDSPPEDFVAIAGFWNWQNSDFPTKSPQSYST